MVVSRQSIELAVRNIAHWGDTDVLPFPLENHWFYDAEDQVVKLLAGLDRQFDQWLTVWRTIRRRKTDTALAQVYGKTDSTLVRRDTILCMARRGVEYWLGDQIRNAGTTDLWLRRALLAGSFMLGDEGAHWRKRVKNELHRVDQEFMAWLEEKHTAGSWKVPL